MQDKGNLIYGSSYVYINFSLVASLISIFYMNLFLNKPVSLILACAREQQQKKRKEWRHIKKKNQQNQRLLILCCENWEASPDDLLWWQQPSFFFFPAFATLGSEVHPAREGGWPRCPTGPSFRLPPLLCLSRLALHKSSLFHTF